MISTNTYSPLAWRVGILFLAINTTALSVHPPCPLSITARIPSNDLPDASHPAVFQTIEDVHVTLLRCPGVASLTLRIASLGCAVHPDRYSLPFDLASGETYPPLESLSLEGYSFGDSEWGRVSPPFETRLEYMYEWVYWVTSGKAKKWWNWRKLPPEQRSKTNIELWMDAMDFSKLKHLALLNHHHPSYLATTRFPSLLSSLRSLTVVEKNATEFILTLPQNSLEELRWIYPDAENDTIKHGTMAKIMEHVGSGLHTLELHTPEYPADVTPTLTPESLSLLPIWAPNLRNLTLDLNRREGPENTTWPLPELTSLASNLPDLVDLTVYFELGSAWRRAQDPWEVTAYWSIEPPDGENELAHPLLSEEAAVELFRALQEARNGMKPLERVLFRTGDWTRPWDGPIYLPVWLEGKQAWAECSGYDGEEKCEFGSVDYGEYKRRRVRDEL